MLRHEDSSEPRVTQDGSAPAAEVRVTAEELARAVARYQARREEAAQRLEGTLTIGEAVRELGLDVTPEELLAEVQTERTLEETPKVVKRPRWGLFAAGLGMMALLCFCLDLSRQSVGPATEPAVAVSVMPAQSQTSAVSVTASDSILVQDSSGPMPVLRTLGEIPDDRPVRAALDQTDIGVTFSSFSAPNTAWTLVKHGGRVYVRAWMAAMSPTAMQVSPVSLYRQKSLVPSGVAPQAVTLPLDGFQASPGMGDDDAIVALHVRPDPHFTELWPSEK